MKLPYQLLPDLTTEEYETLKADIAERGVMVPVEQDEDGNILDGHHRVAACNELGIDVYPTVVRSGMTEDQKRLHAIKLNVARRQVTREQRIEVMKQMRSCGHSVRSIAEAIHASPTTVQREVSGVPNGTPEVTGKDGKKYSSRKPREPKQPAPEVELSSDPIPLESAGRKSTALNTANEIINQLMRIPVWDPKRERALEMVSDWIDHNK